MHHTAQYNFPAPIISGRTGGAVTAGLYNSYDPRVAPPTAPAAVVSRSPPPAAMTTTRGSSRTSTEFRGSTNPSEDWTKISDLAERRRIQNRIAQRNYRKKLKRRLEDLERRAKSRSLSPVGDDAGDGRSSRETSSENHAPNGSKHHQTSTATNDTITVPAQPATSTYEYASAYSTAGTPTPYPSQYRTAGGYSSAASPPPQHYATSSYDTSPGHFAYSSYDTPQHSSTLPPSHHTYHGSSYNTPETAVDPHLLLPLPSLTSSSASSTPASSTASSPAQRSIPGTSTVGLKNQGLYDLDNGHSAASSTGTVSPYILANSYDSVHDQYNYCPAGVSSSFYNLDYSAPLPPLLGHNAASSMGRPIHSSAANSGRYTSMKKEGTW